MEKSEITTKQIIASGRRLGKSLALGMNYGASATNMRLCMICHKRKKDIFRPLCDKCEEAMNTEMGRILYG